MIKAGVHAVATLVGVAIIGCVVHASIMASGGYAAAAAPLMLALGCGLGIGSIAVGIAWSDRRMVGAAGLIVALVAGEALCAHPHGRTHRSYREAQQAPLKADELARTKATQRIMGAEDTIANAAKDTPRLIRALATKKAVDEAVVEKSAEKGCASNCRVLLEQQVAAASTELENARREATAALVVAKQDLADARQALAGLPTRGSASPLADRLGIAGWELDLAAAALASLAANGLAAMLIAFGVHGLIVGATVAACQLHQTRRRSLRPSRQGLCAALCLARSATQTMRRTSSLARPSCLGLVPGFVSATCPRPTAAGAGTPIACRLPAAKCAARAPRSV